MGLFDKIREPVFLKEDSEAVQQLQQLEALLPLVAADMKEELENEIRIVKAGIRGEEAIAFELRNSHLPMFILHDLLLEYKGLTAQIDYLIVTRKKVFVIECKNLVGNIEINSSGDFIRTVPYGQKRKTEGIYSPVTQNKRHLELIKQIRADTKANVLQRRAFENNFYNSYSSVVVLANPQSVLNARYAKKDVRQQVIRVDQLVEHIRTVLTDPDSGSISEKTMEETAQYFLGLHRPRATDYAARYRQQIVVLPQAESQPKAAEDDVPVCPQCGATMVRRVAKRGANAGNEFFGCTNYPQCKCIINITE